MSGSGGGGGYDPPPAVKFNCITSVIKTAVSSINIDVLNKHDVGAILDVNIDNNSTVLIEDGDGEILGSILHLNSDDLVACIKAGNTYSAEIIAKTAVSCTVLIKCQ
jgi:hypothetical protein